MTEITSDNEGPPPSNSAPMDGTQVTDASSTSSTKAVLAQLSNAMVKLTTEMSQLRHEHQTLQQPRPIPHNSFPPQYYPHVQPYETTVPPPMPRHDPTSYVPHPTILTPPTQMPPYSQPNTTRQHRNPQREKSKKAFYGVRNGLSGNAVYPSWPECAQDVFDMNTQSYRPGTQFRGFDSYTLAYLFSIGVDDPATELRTNPSIISHYHPTPDEPNFSTQDDTPPPGDDTYLSVMLNDNKIPSDVSYSHNSVTSTTSDFHSSIMKERNLPRYTGKEDLSIFLHKLKPLLERPDINNCHLDPSTTLNNMQHSTNLATLLWVCLDNALSPFVNNDLYINKGIEMLHTLKHNAYPKSRSAANAIMANLHTIKINQNETFEQFGKRLRTLYATCLQNGYHNDPHFLPRCFLNGLDANFDRTREMIQHGSLDWSDYSLNQCIQAANMIKLNLVTADKWKEYKASASQAGKQGALRPQTTTPAPTPAPPTKLPTYCLKENLSPQDVEWLMKRYSCFICRRKNHAFHECGLVKRFYTITPLADSQATQPTRSNPSQPPRPPTNRQHHTTVANLASLPITVTDSPERYDGYADAHPSTTQSTTHTTTYGSPVDTDNPIADNTTNTTVSTYSFKFCRGSAKRVKFSTHIDPNHFFTHSKHISSTCIIQICYT